MIYGMYMNVHAVNQPLRPQQVYSLVHKYGGSHIKLRHRLKLFIHLITVTHKTVKYDTVLYTSR